MSERQRGDVATLVGVATGRPDGGIAVVRLSGPSSFAIARQLVGELPSPRRLAGRRLRLATGDEQALVVCMPGPGSYTGEDVVELHVHAGALNVAEVIERLLALGARAAGPGEFTRRAFENGRVGLEQAEGVAAVIGAQTERSLAQARRLVAGELGRAVDAVQEEIRALRVEVEANLDFPDDVSFSDLARWRELLGVLSSRLRVWSGQFEAGRRARERARFVLAGPPNAGKSSLFNALLGRARALVADSPGTTRDYVEADLELDGYLAVLVDTAGLREGARGVEGEGVTLTREQLVGADLIIWLEGADTVPGGTEVAALGDAREAVWVESKRDLGARREEWVGVSAASPGGAEPLRERLREWFRAGQEDAWIGLARHRDRVVEAEGGLREALEALEAEAGSLEIVAFALGIAERRLGEIRGRHVLGPVGSDVLDAIFMRFCVGK